jgi:SAM-dependent methyltransferase
VSNLDLIRNGRHYDALKAQNDVPFYLAQAQAVSGPVLEIGCGTGRLTIPLAAAGVDIIGLDVSASMLEEARRKAEGQGIRIRWIEGDGRDLRLDRRFALIIMPFNTLQFFRDTAALEQLFHGVKSHLVDPGRFVFDVFNPQVSFLAADPSARYERARYADPDGGGEVVIEETREYIAERQVVRSTRYYHVGGKRDVSVSSLELRCFFPCELDLILQHFGFRLKAKYGDFDNSPLSSPSPKQVCICSRAPALG